MTKTLNITFASALLAASVFGGSAALAASDGDYYQGNSRLPVQAQSVDRVTTQSIGNGAVKVAPTGDEVGPANGDYYQGASKQR